MLQPSIIGDLCEKDKKNVFITGSMNMSSYGKSVIEHIVPQLIKAEYAIVSGFSRGCESYAHEIAMKNNGRVIGAIDLEASKVKESLNGFFINKVLEYKNRVVIMSTAEEDKSQILAAVANRIIVIEAGERDPVFRLVNYFLDMGKDIYSVPGDIFRTGSLGTNRVIKEGGFLLTGIEDLL